MINSFSAPVLRRLLMSGVVVVSFAVLTGQPLTAFAAEHGREVYNARCYYCHGYAGDARTVAASYLTPAPRDFTAAQSAQMSREHMIAVVREGRAGTAMKGFASMLSAADIEAVVDFVREGFMARPTVNLSYHSAPNGWQGDPFASVAAPFALGELSLDTAVETLTARQASGRALYLSSCISCHSRGQAGDAEAGEIWRNEAVSYPLGNYIHDIERILPAKPILRPATSVFDSHAVPPALELTEHEREGEEIYAVNCAFCHAADGSGLNWFGSFVEPPPPDFRRVKERSPVSRAQLENLILDGVVGGAMPAWRHVLEPAAVDALTDYMRRAFARFRPQESASPRAANIPDQKRLFQKVGKTVDEKPHRPPLTFKSVPIRP